MSVLVVLYMLEIVGFLIIGLLAFLRRRTLLNTAFAFFAMLLAIWQGLQGLALVFNGSPAFATALLMTSVALSPVVAASLYIFTRVHAKKKPPYYLFIFAAGIGAVAYLSDSLREVAILPTGIGIPRLDVYYSVILLFIIFILALSLKTLIGSYVRKGVSRQEKIQTGIMLGSAGSMGVLALFASFYTSDFSQSLVAQQIIPIAGLLTLLAFLYAMTRHGLFDIKLAAVRSLVYVLSLCTLAGIYYAAAYVVSAVIFRGQVGTEFSLSPLNIFLALGLAFIFQPIKRTFDWLTDGIFYRHRYSSEEFFTRFNEVLMSTTDLRSLLERVSQEVATTIKAEYALLYIRYGDNRHISAGTTKRLKLPREDMIKLDGYMEERDSTVVIADGLPESDPMYRLLVSHKIALLMPLRRSGSIIGYVMLGDQQSTGYTVRDARVLRSVSSELIIAIQNALSVQEVKDINAKLEQRIDAATKELRTSNARLRHLDTTKDEFLSMASHQLRTPLTSVKGYLSMVLEGDAGEVTSAQRHLLGEAFSSSERMVHLIHDFLNVSRLQTGKFMLDRHPYDLAKIAEEEVQSLLRSAELRSIQLNFINKAGEMIVDIDENKIRQVLMNFIDNALYYSKEGSKVTVELDKTSSLLSLRVKDNGIGVPAHEQKHLFGKFYRASNARMQRPDGTGVGIFLAKKVIDGHGGRVIFESTENKGSTFGFTLPLPKEKDKKAKRQISALTRR